MHCAKGAAMAFSSKNKDRRFGLGFVCGGGAADETKIPKSRKCGSVSGKGLFHKAQCSSTNSRNVNRPSRDDLKTRSADLATERVHRQEPFPLRWETLSFPYEEDAHRRPTRRR